MFRILLQAVKRQEIPSRRTRILTQLKVFVQRFRGFETRHSDLPFTLDQLAGLVLICVFNSLIHSFILIQSFINSVISFMTGP